MDLLTKWRELQQGMNIDPLQPIEYEFGSAEPDDVHQFIVTDSSSCPEPDFGVYAELE